VRRRLAWAVLDATLLLGAFGAGWLTVSDVIVALWLEAVLLLVAIPLLIVTAGRRLARPHPHLGRAPGAGTVPASPFEMTDADRLRLRLLYGQKATWAAAAFFVLHFGVFTVVTGIVGHSVVAGVGQVTAPLWLLVVRVVTSRVGYLLQQVKVLADDDFAGLGTKIGEAMGLPYYYLIPMFIATVWLASSEVAVSTAMVVALVVAGGLLVRHPQGRATPPTRTRTPPRRCRCDDLSRRAGRSKLAANAFVPSDVGVGTWVGPRRAAGPERFSSASSGRLRARVEQVGDRVDADLPQQLRAAPIAKPTKV